MIFTAIATGLAALAFLTNQEIREKQPDRIILVREAVRPMDSR